jgi:poly-gamma-glutamate synthesis protein (capsule biosynthesis protein)
LAGHPYSGYPQFSSPDELAYDIKNTGFKILVMANNHCYDRGKYGFQRTLAIIDSIGIPHLGTYKDSIQRSRNYPFITDKKGIRIALLNYTYGTNGLVPEKPNIVNYISKRTIADDLVKAKSLKADYIIAVMHWGKEYELKPNKEQIDLAKFLVKHGCDAIIGSHPHVVQTFEIIYPDTTDSTHFIPVFYSLGNLISNQRDRYRDGGAIFKLTLEKIKAKTHAVECSYLPYWVYRGALKGKYQYYVVPTNLFDNKPDSLKIPVADSVRIKEFESDIHLQLPNLKESDFFNLNKK